MQLNNVIVSIDENKDNKGDNMELIDVNVVIECGNPQYAIGSDKIIGYEEVEVCGECGAIIKSKTHKYCTQCGTKIREEVSSSQNDFKDLNDENKDNKGDKMVKVYRDEDLDTMTDEQYDNLGCIYEATTEEQKDTMYKNQSEVIMALINTFKVDLRSTEAYEKLIDEVKRNTTPINTNQFYDVLYNELFEWDCPMINMDKNIKIECVVEDASFDYEYGDICATHTCYIPLGYNIIIEDID